MMGHPRVYIWSQESSSSPSLIVDLFLYNSHPSLVALFSFSYRIHPQTHRKKKQIDISTMRFSSFAIISTALAAVVRAAPTPSPIEKRALRRLGGFNVA
jgi:hypothetical protein